MDSVRITGLRKRFSRTGPWVLDGVDATLPAGAVTLLAGGNGSGKSTLLRVVAGASAPTGNQQKVALAVALLEPAAVLVLDEPYGGLDGPAAQALTGLVADARATGTAVLLSGHDPAVFPAADAVLRISAGRLTGAGAAVPTRLVLRRIDPSAVPLEGDWDPGRELLTVLTPDPDAVLRAALAGGWSFVEGLVRS